ncbi:DNA cytosine methyltransferase [Parasphingorhabdus litoris]|uniref:DNA (cytosine-5-)-methyltransferase n=1 Tax=Parasphingorhabdus litoris TaxID=394733 RepID=A0ABN1AL24_9SPHN|nr:DNA cytosine methyltransferase [Parasphingorhabdus litoris]
MNVGQLDELIEKLPRRARPGRQKKPKFLAVDFFCGAGGTTRGLIDAGGYVIAGIDKDRASMETFVSNNGNEALDRGYAKFLEFDIFPATDKYPTGQQHEIKAKLDELIPPIRDKAPDIPLLFAICAPCQPFTTVARAKMTKEREAVRLMDRGLLTEAAKFVEAYRPEVVLSENVAGISDPKYGGIWTEFERRLQAIGYKTGTRVVCASKFGIPQSRRRSILIAVRSDRIADQNLQAINVPTEDEAVETVTVGEALSSFPKIDAGEIHDSIANHRAANLSDLNKQRLICSIPGGSNRDLKKTKFGDLTLKCHQNVSEKFEKNCFGDTYSRMHPDRVSPTITTKCYSITNGRFGHFDTDQVRAISMREAATLQSFPSEYIFYPDNKLQPVAKMIGNAVPPKLAEYFSKYSIGLLE